MMTMQIELKKQAYASDLKSRALSILMYLIDRSNKELTCFPSISTMAEQLHISVSTVKRALHELVNAGFIKKTARFREKNLGQTSNLYTLVLKEKAHDKKEVAAAKVEESIVQNKSKAFAPVVHIDFATLKAEEKPVDERAFHSADETQAVLPNLTEKENQLPVQALEADSMESHSESTKNKPASVLVPCQECSENMMTQRKKQPIIRLVQRVNRQIRAICSRLISGNPISIER